MLQEFWLAHGYKRAELWQCLWYFGTVQVCKNLAVPLVLKNLIRLCELWLAHDYQNEVVRTLAGIRLHG